MDVLILSAVARAGLAVGPTPCTFRVVHDGIDLPVDAGGAVQLPDDDRPLRLTIEATPGSDFLFPARATFDLDDAGGLTEVPDPQTGKKADPGAFLPSQAATVSTGKVVLVVVFLSRLQDASEDTGPRIVLTPKRRLNRFPVPLAVNWDTPVETVGMVNAAVLAGNQLAFDPPAAVDPQTDNFVLRLRLAAKEAPQLLAVAWPKSLPPDAGPTPFLVYFHSGVTQNAGQNYEIPGDREIGTYPNGWDYLVFGLLRYLRYFGDPLQGGDAPFTKGLPYQAATSGKKVVTVLPLSRVGSEVGVLLDADSMNEVLLEIQAFFIRRAGSAVLPGLGRVALGAFSSGNNLVTTFLSKNQNNAFCQETLKEIYNFDGPRKDEWAAQAATWLASGSAPADKMIRAYVQASTNALSNLIGPAAAGAVPRVAASADGNRTLAILPLTTWASAVTAAGGTPSNEPFQEAHQLMSSTMLTDALRRSGF